MNSYFPILIVEDFKQLDMKGILRLNLNIFEPKKIEFSLLGFLNLNLYIWNKFPTIFLLAIG